jgi:glycosyltransferase involved in cell wall biosynthesis
MRPSAALQRLRQEGIRSVLARALDHAEDRRRERSYRPTTAGDLRLTQPPPVLNLLGFPPRRSRGGVALQWLDRLEVEARERTVARLFPLAGGLRLEIDDRGTRLVVDLGRSGDARTWSAAIDRAMTVTGASWLHVETFAGLPAEALPKRPALASIHDFSGLESPFVDWLAQVDHLVFASEFMRRAAGERFPELASRPASVIPPAILLPDLPLTTTRRIEGPLHVAFAGALSLHKGADLLPELIRATIAHGARFSAYGAGDDFSPRDLRRLGAAATGWYRARTLSTILRRDRVDLCLVPSRAEESHCLVIDECWWAGVPVLVSDRGALPERVNGGGGLARPLPQLASTLAGLLAEPARLALASSAAAPTRVGVPSQAANLHRQIYRRVAGRN